MLKSLAFPVGRLASLCQGPGVGEVGLSEPKDWGTGSVGTGLFSLSMEGSSGRQSRAVAGWTGALCPSRCGGATD